MNSTMPMRGLALCPLLGLLLLLGVIVFLLIRSPKARWIALGVLSVCVLASLFLVTVRTSRTSESRGIGTDVTVQAFSFPALGKPEILIIAAVVLAITFIVLVGWGFARNPSKGFAAIGGILLSLFLVGILVTLVAILLPPAFRARAVSERNAARMSAPPPSVVAMAQPAPPSSSIEAWLAAAAASKTGVRPYACRELACVALTQSILTTLREQGVLSDKSDAPFFLMMELRFDTPQETWQQVTWAIDWARDHDARTTGRNVVRIDWPWRRAPGAPAAPKPTPDSPTPSFGPNAVIVQWAGTGGPNGSGEVTVNLRLPPRIVTNRQDGREVRTTVQDVKTFRANHQNKGWVLERNWPVGRPGPFIVGRSQPMASTHEGSQAAYEDAARQLARKIREQLESAPTPAARKDVTARSQSDTMPPNSPVLPEQVGRVVEEAMKIAEQAAKLGENSGTAADEWVKAAAEWVKAAERATQNAPATANVPPTVTPPKPFVAPSGDPNVSVEQVDKLVERMEQLAEQGEKLGEQGEKLGKQAEQVSAPPLVRDTARAQRRALESGVAQLRKQAEVLQQRSQQAPAVARNRNGASTSLSDARSARASALAAQIVAGHAAYRMDECIQPVDSPSGLRYMAAVLIDAAPASIDRLLGQIESGTTPTRPPLDWTSRQGLAVGFLLAMVVLAYAFLVAGRYGFLKWPLRSVIATAFVIVCLLVMKFIVAADVPAAPTRFSLNLPSFPSLNLRSSPALSDRLVALAKTSADGVAMAVTTAESTNIDDSRLKPLDRLVCGEYLLLGGHADRAVKCIESAIRAGGCENWYDKSLGLARLWAGRPEDARRAFARAAGNANSWKTKPVASASIDAWTAAYFLDWVSQAEYADCVKKLSLGDSMACFPWFYIGQRMEIEGKRDEAIAAYRKSVDLGERSGGHYIRYWSAYRLDVLTGTDRAPSPSRSTGLPSSRPGRSDRTPSRSPQPAR